MNLLASERKVREAEAVEQAEAEVVRRAREDLDEEEEQRKEKRQEKAANEFVTIYQINQCSSMSLEEIGRQVDEKMQKDLEEEKAQQLALREKLVKIENAAEIGAAPPAEASCVVPAAQTVDTDECECLGKPKEKETPFQARIRLDREKEKNECNCTCKEAFKCCKDCQGCLLKFLGCIDECIANTCCNLTLNPGSASHFSIWWIWLISFLRRIFSLSPIFIGVWSTVSNISATGFALVAKSVPSEFNYGDSIAAYSYLRNGGTYLSGQVLQCDYGNPSFLEMSCDPTIYSLYTALMVLWMAYFGILFFFHLGFSWKYSPFDLRYYVSLQKANKSPFNTYYVGAGICFTIATTVVGLIYVFRLNSNNRAEAFTAASTIFQFFIVNFGVLIPFTGAMFDRVQEVDMDDFSAEIWSANAKKINCWESEDNRKKFEKKFGRKLHKQTATAEQRLLSRMSQAVTKEPHFSSAEEGIIFRGDMVKGHGKITGVELTPELMWFLYETNENGEYASPPVLKTGDNRVFVTAEAGLTLGTVVIQVEDYKPAHPSGAICTVSLVLSEKCLRTLDKVYLDFYDKGSYPFPSLQPTLGCCALTVDSVFSEIKDMMVATHLYNKRHKLQVELLDRIGDGTQILETMELMYVYDNPDFPEPTPEEIESIEKLAQYKLAVAKHQRSSAAVKAAKARLAADKEADRKDFEAKKKLKEVQDALENKTKEAEILRAKKDPVKYAELQAAYDLEKQQEKEMEDVFREV